MLTDEKRIEGRDVLRAVEEQHGLLVNRYEDIYSFSHLTIQEFLTAKHIIDNQLDISAIVKEHLCDKRWREVFLLLAGLRKADELLIAIDQEAMNYMATPKLQRLLAWVEEVTNPTPGDFQPVGKRAFAIANANAIANNSIANDNARSNVTNAIAYSISITSHIIARNAISDHIIACAIANNTIAYSIANSNTAIDYFIKYAKRAIEFKIYQGLDLAATISKLEKMRDQIPDANHNQPHVLRRKFARQLIEIFLATFHLTSEMVDLSKKEIRAMDNYLYVIMLLIECERAAVRRTPEVWSQIEERLLITAATN
jgi:hypothetical protein